MNMHYSQLGFSLLSLLTGVLIAAILSLGLTQSAMLINKQHLLLASTQAESQELELLMDKLVSSVRAAYQLGCLADNTGRLAIRVTENKDPDAPNLSKSSVLDLLVAKHLEPIMWHKQGSNMMLRSDEKLPSGSLLAAKHCNHTPIVLDDNWRETKKGYWLPICQQPQQEQCFNAPKGVDSGELIRLERIRFYVRNGQPSTLYQQSTKSPGAPRWHSEQIGQHAAILDFDSGDRAIEINITLSVGRLSSRVVDVERL